MLKIGDKKYYINKKKGTVAAVATSCLDISNDYEPNASPVEGAILTDAICDAFGQAVFLMKPAVARCSDGDTLSPLRRRCSRSTGRRPSSAMMSSSDVPKARRRERRNN